MNIHAKLPLFAPAIPVQTPRAPLVAFTPASTNTAPRAGLSFSEDPRQRQKAAPASGLRKIEASSIYVVDDVPSLTEMYTALLAARGYMVRAFNDRAEALAALTVDPDKPDLLITDYLGLSMPVDQFMHRCLVLHPDLRILMASGFSRTDVRFSQVRPDRFIQKPFSPEELLEEVEAALAG